MEIWEEIAADPQMGARLLVAEYGDRLFTAAFQITQNAADAEDLVFRTFARVVERISMYDGRSAFFSWLYAVMLNFRRMDLRRKGANALVFDGEIPECEDLSPNPAELLALKSDACAVRAAVAELDEALRTIVVLHYFEDMDISEIARLTESPIGTVKFRMYRARKILADRLAQTFFKQHASNTMKEGPASGKSRTS
jgi:RNA polymerase sigma-70 factor (ECF subfamily)